MKTLEITTPFHKQKIRKSQSTKKTPQKAYMHTHVYTYTQRRRYKIIHTEEREIHTRIHNARNTQNT